MITRMKDEKVIILSTHILEEVEAICTRAIIISEGIVKVDGTPSELKKRSEYCGAVLITLPKNEAENLKPEIKALDGVNHIEELQTSAEEGKLSLRCYPEKDQNITVALANLLKSKNVNAEEFHVEQGRLDEVFRKITKSE